MPSTLTWPDHDAAARERSLRILMLFQEKESRDGLGLGAIRDSFSDKLFPDTRFLSVIPFTSRERWFTSRVINITP